MFQASASLVGPKVVGNPYDLHPNLFRQLLDRGHLVKTDEGPKRFFGCVGHFFDPVTKRQVHVDFGFVFCRPVFSYRAASSANSADSSLSFEGHKMAEEGAAQCENSSAAYRPQRSEDGTHAVDFRPGPYVIPGHVATDCQNTQKIDCFEWSIEKCEAEAC